MQTADLQLQSMHETIIQLSEGMRETEKKIRDLQRFYFPIFLQFPALLQKAAWLFHAYSKIGGLMFAYTLMSFYGNLSPRVVQLFMISFF